MVSTFIVQHHSVCESFFNSLKHKEIYRPNYTSKKHLQTSQSEYVVFHNDKRPHTLFRKRTPNKAEADFYNYLKENFNVPI